MSSKNSLTYDELVERTQVELRQYYGEEHFEDVYSGDIYYGSYLELMEAMMPHHYSEGFRFTSEVREGFIEEYKKDELENDLIQPLDEDRFYQTLLKMREDEETPSQRNDTQV